MLWVALHLPLLSLESFIDTMAPRPGMAAASPAAGQPVALVDQHKITAANAAALAQGVKPGLKRATALALAPQIVLGQADAGRDARAMVPLAHAALAFTPAVCLQPPAERDCAASTVLLEVSASLRYFGGLEPLLGRLQEAVRPLGHACRIATAATAQGAGLLALLEAPPRCTDLASTRHALAGLPVWLLGPGREHWEGLQGMGLRTLSDLLPMPRAGLARRFGEPLLAEIDAALGRRPDPRQPLALPPAFESRLELFARADTTEQVLHGASVLLERLLAWLAAKHAYVRRFRLLMRHESRWQQSDRTPQVTALEIALAEPSRDGGHLMLLLRERLAHVQLQAPTIEIAIQAEDIARRPAPNQELFPTRQSTGEGVTRLIERLQARLGQEQVQHPVQRDDHRPEHSTIWCTVDAAKLGRPAEAVAARQARLGRPAPPPAQAAADLVADARPLWLQPAPEPLAEQHTRPLLEGRPLRLLSGPERVETGWWDDGLAERDYFVAEAGDGALVWIYRTRLPPAAPAAETTSGWFLHGRFG